jgi:hypothetical protein
MPPHLHQRLGYLYSNSITRSSQEVDSSPECKPFEQNMGMDRINISEKALVCYPAKRLTNLLSH